MTRTFKALFLAALLAPTAAAAQQVDLTPAILDYNQGKYAEAAGFLYEAINTTGDPAIRAKAEFYLGQTLEKMGMFQSALYYYGLIVNTGVTHPFYVNAVQGLVDVSEKLDDDLFVPTLLNKQYNDEFAKLKPEYINKVNYLVGLVAYRGGQFDDALAFLDTVPEENPYFARAQYLRGIVTIQKGRQDGTLEDATRTAQGYFQRVLNLNPYGRVIYTDLKDLRDLSRMGLARTHYGLGNYAEAVKYFDEVPRFSEYWADALFENGWARFLNEDWGGSIGSLQALHAPQFAGAFQPESWILKSIVYFNACLYDESKAALEKYTKNYTPMNQVITQLLDGDRELTFYYDLIRKPEERQKLPRAVYTYLAANTRVRGFNNYLATMRQERAAILATPRFKKAGLDNELVESIDQTTGQIEQVAGKFIQGRLRDALQVVTDFDAQAEVIKFETAKAEKERLESGANFQQALAAQNLLRPRVPAEDWEYWKFQGEFWIDEIGYYQFTLKSGCDNEEE